MYRVLSSCCGAGSVGYRWRRGLGARPWVGTTLRIRPTWDLLVELWAYGMWGFNYLFTMHIIPPKYRRPSLESSWIRGCLEKALVMKFTLTPGVQALHTQAGGSVMYVLSVNE